MSDIDDVFALLGFGKMQYIVLFACLVMQMWITNEQMGIAVVIAGASCELEIVDYRVAWLMACNFGSQMLSCYMWGELSDGFGRRRVILIAGLTAILLSLLSACMPEFWSFLVLRTLQGFFISGSLVCTMTYLSEFTKVSLRPRVQNIMSYAIGLSLIYVPSLAGVLLPLEMEPIGGWRILLICNQIPGILGLISLIFLPESPKYCLSTGNPEKAMNIMEKVCRLNKGKDVTLASLGVDSLTQPRLRPSQMVKDRCHDTKNLMTTHARFMCIFFFIFFSLSGIAFALPIWMLRIRVLVSHFEEPQTICDHLKGVRPERSQECELGFKEMMDPIIHGFVVLGLFVLTSVLLICLKRRIVIVTYTVVAIAGCVALNFMKHPDLILASFFAIIDPPLCSIRLAGSLLIDLVPTHLRGKAFALISMLGRCGVLITSLYVGYTLTHSCLVTFNLLILILLVCGILVLLLPTDVKIRSITQ
ncbi:putative transporter SVOPL isoform X2 [Drosophila rhopaloa]|uniref:Major facilitator superfamily (MFS) profile domain-containing protein n=1 Tax=Drosophila rhopaloa TaxID=1041015 RepID=A0ABM5J5S4_DRORH|nr:putative transporter SVOPL isoform X2 [Drosophila rhopaloa]